jgi:glycine/D-amino acid oxidase-like deaminating enzyme
VTTDPRPRPLPNSVYAETATVAPETRPLRGDRRASVVVVGGGFTGLSAALHLASGGTDVTLLEAHEPGWGASGRNGGQVNPGLKHDPDDILRDFGPELGGRMIRLSGGAPEAVFRLVERHQITCEAHQGGTLRAAYQPGPAAGLQATARQWLAHGAPIELLDATRTADVTGTTRYRAAMLDRRGGSLNPLGYARGLARQAIAAGAHIHAASPALRMQRDGAAWRVETPGGSVRADTVILATNGYTDSLWPKLRRSIVPVYSAIIATEPLAESLASRIMPTRSVLYEAARVTVYYRLDQQRRLLMGGRAAQRDLTQRAGYAHLVRYAVRLWPHLAAVRWTHWWNGQLALTADAYPHLHMPAPGVWAGLGYNGRGIAMATALGGELARAALGAPAGDLNMPVTTIREMPFHRLWRAGVTAGMAYGRMRDFLGL